MKEEWKLINCVSNPRHEVSNLGRVRFLGRDFYNQYGALVHIAPNENVKGYVDKKGYTHLNIWDSEKKRYISTTIHRLVAEAFIPNPKKLPFINHKDESPLNNRVDNLEWCDCCYNNHYGTALERASKTRSLRGISKSIDVYTKDGKLIASFMSIYEAGKALNVSYENIHSACKNKARSLNGYVFRFKGEPFDYVFNYNREVTIFDIYKNGEFVYRANGTTDASNFLNIKRSCMKGKLHRFNKDKKDMVHGDYTIKVVCFGKVRDKINRPDWVHVSYREGNNRKQVLSL